MKAVVTGGAGFIGSYLTCTLLQMGWEVIVIDTLSSKSLLELPEVPSLHLYKLDIQDQKILQIYKLHKPNIVFHLAASYANELSVINPFSDLNINARGTLFQLKASLSASVGRFVYASSSCVYHPLIESLPENTCLNPKTPYGISKLTGEHYCNFYSSYYGLPVTIVRYFNSYGPGEPVNENRGVVARFMAKTLERKPLPITGNGEESRDFTYVEDTVEGTILAGTKEGAINEVFNIGSGRAITIRELAETIRNITGEQVPLHFAPPRAWDKTAKRKSCTKKTREKLGFRPRHSLEKGLRKTWNWYKANYNRLKALK